MGTGFSFEVMEILWNETEMRLPNPVNVLSAARELFTLKWLALPFKMVNFT